MRLRRLQPLLRRALRGPCALPRGARILVAVSGGADSTALLLGLHALARERGLRLHAAHLHHGLRGAEADGDLSFVRALCARLRVPLTAARWDAPARMRRRGLSGQQGLRTLRQEFLTAVARRAGARAIATGHTADDQLETLLLRLLRGAGLTGLGGMSARRGLWIKPLLAATRDEVEVDLRAAGQPWREDRSNLDLSFARSRVRHQVIPALLKARHAAPSAPGPDDEEPDRDATGEASPRGARASDARARARLARSAAECTRELRSARRMARRIARAAWAQVARDRGGEIGLDARALAAYPLVIRRMVLRLLWHRFGSAGKGLTQRHLNALQSLLATSRGGSRVDLADGCRAERGRGMIVLRRPGGPARPAARRPVPGRGPWVRGPVRGGWLSGEAARERLRSRAAGEEIFAAEEIAGGLELRPGRSDEWFVPFGAGRPRRLGEFLSKQPVPPALRARPMVLADARGILWVVGVRRAARAPVTDATRRALWVHAEAL